MDTRSIWYSVGGFNVLATEIVVGTGLSRHIPIELPNSEKLVLVQFINKLAKYKEISTKGWKKVSGIATHFLLSRQLVHLKMAHLQNTTVHFLLPAKHS